MITFEEILAKQSLRDGEQRYTESQIRDLVGAPSLEEDGDCICGQAITDCNEAYVHMTSGT